MEPEQLLFIRIIIQAIEDTLYKSKPKNNNNREELKAKREAIRWFKLNSEDYQEICHHANIESQSLRIIALSGDKEKIKELINEYRKLDRDCDA